MASWPCTCRTPAWASCRKAEAGVGLANIRERLQALYNGRAELIISVPPEGGTCATIKVPYEVAPAAPPDGTNADRMHRLTASAAPPPSLPTMNA